MRESRSPDGDGELFRSVVQTASDAIICIDSGGNITFWNRAAEIIFGYSSDEMLGKPHTLIMPERFRKMSQAGVERVVKTGRTRIIGKTVEVAGLRKDGSEFPVELSLARWMNGEEVFFTGIVRDITERKKIEAERAQLTTIIEATSDFVAIADRDERVHYMNSAGRRMLGIGPDEPLTSLRIHETHPPRDYHTVLHEAIPTAIRDGIWVGETRLLGRTGREIAVSQVILAHKTPGGTLEFLSTIARDISEQKRMEEALRKARDELEIGVEQRTAELARANEELRIEIVERKRVEAERKQLLRRIAQLADMAQRRAAELHGIIASMVDGVFVCDVEGSITLANDAGAQLLGLSNVEEAKRSISEIPGLLRMRHPDGKPMAIEDLPLVRALRGETVVQEEFIIYNSRTRRDAYLRTSAAPVRDENGKIVGSVGITRDVTELTELDRLKDQFIFVAAHELKTPVAIMKGYAQAMLRMAGQIPESGRKMLEAIDRGSDRIDRIVRDLLDISQIQLGSLEITVGKVDLSEMVEEVVNRIAPMSSKHRIAVVKAEPVVVRCDRTRIEQVLVTLIDNAIRYSPKGGDVDVAVDVQDYEAVVSVRDYGVGIPAEKQARIFERFYRAHTGTPYDYGGMGVGLYISKEIISRHGGRMWFQSEEDKGSAFYFSLPLRSEQDSEWREGISGPDGDA